LLQGTTTRRRRRRPRRTAVVYNILYINILQEGNHIRPWPVGLIINPDPV